MKLGLGLYRHMLTRENFQFACQAGATHIVAHLVDYFKGAAQNSTDNQPTGTERGWGLAGDPEKLWTVEELTALRKSVETEGLKLEAIENLDPAHWHDILLDGPKRFQQLENVKMIIRRMGDAGIPILGYNFSLAGVCGRTHAAYARGGAMSVGMEGPFDTPMPNGMVWNMVYETVSGPGTVAPVAPEALWSRWERFIEEVLPVAGQAVAEIFLSAVLGMYLTNLYARHRPVRLAVDPAFAQLTQERRDLESRIAAERLSFGEATGHLVRLDSQLAALVAFGKSMFHREAARRQDESQKRQVILDQLSDHLRTHLESAEQGNRLVANTGTVSIATKNGH